MNQSPFFSLILCVKDGMPFLPYAMESVISQTYKNYELIVQDCKSIDGSLEFLIDVQKRHKNIKMDIVSEYDGGIGPAYNRALSRCKGDIIGSIDADNTLEPDALEIIINSFNKYPDAAAIYTNKFILDYSGKISTSEKKPFDLLRVMACEIVPPFANSFFSRLNCGTNLYFNEQLRTCADFDLWLRIGHLQIIHIPEYTGTTRISAQSMSCRVETYDQFCQDKIFSIEEYFHKYEPNVIMEKIKSHSIAGVYIWAAYAVKNLVGKTEQCLGYIKKAEIYDPCSPQLQILRNKFEIEENHGSRTSRLRFFVNRWSVRKHN